MEIFELRSRSRYHSQDRFFDPSKCWQQVGLFKLACESLTSIRLRKRTLLRYGREKDQPQRLERQFDQHLLVQGLSEMLARRFCND
jgi:hypothetical protein